MARVFIALIAALFAGALYAQDKPLTAQQERMKDCNAQASGKQLKDGERQEFMSRCLKGEDDSKLTAQQGKMKTCNREASDKKLTGDERQSFMSQCLRSSAS